MRRYFFDTFDDEKIISDDEGLELASFDLVKREATATLGELARDLLPSSDRRSLAVKVRDEKNRSILVAELKFEARAYLHLVD